MIINKFVKKKDGFYQLEINDDEKILVHEDLILKYDLLLKRKITDTDLKKIQKENLNYLLYSKAIKYIGIKMRSVYEVYNYLKKIEDDSSSIGYIVEKLKTQGYLDDKKYSMAYVNDRISLSNDGPLKIRDYLIQNKIEEPNIIEALNIYMEELEKERINKLINKYMKLNNNSGFLLLKKKIVVNLVNLGYHKNTVLEELEKYDVDDSKLYKKEYDKLYDKLSKKYSGYELEYKIKQKLYQKGFLNY